MSRLFRVLRRIPPATCIALGLAAPLAWLTMAWLGWSLDAQILSGTLNPSDPAAGALRGMWIIAARGLSLVASPPLIVGGAIWWAWSALADRKALSA